MQVNFDKCCTKEPFVFVNKLYLLLRTTTYDYILPDEREFGKKEYAQDFQRRRP